MKNKTTDHLIVFENESQIPNALKILDHYKIKARIFWRDSDKLGIIEMIEADAGCANYVLETLRASYKLNNKNRIKS